MKNGIVNRIIPTLKNIFLMIISSILKKIEQNGLYDCFS